MDIGNIISADKLAEFQVLHPVTRTKTGVFVGVYGKYSKAFRDRMNQSTNARQAQMAINARSGVENTVPSVEEQEAENHAILACCIGYWRDESNSGELGAKTKKVDKLEYKGEWLDCNYDNALRVLNDADMRWFVEQVDNKVSLLENFTPG